MESDPIEIRRAKSEDWPQIELFILSTYGATGSHKGKVRWHWQFEINPFRPVSDSGPTVWIALSGDKVVGQIAVQDAACRVEGRQIEAAWIVDVMIEPEFRGRGLGHLLHSQIMRERSCLVTLTMAEATRRIAERAGCLRLGPTQQYLCPRNITMRTVRRYLMGKEIVRPDLALTLRLFSNSLVGPAAIAVASRIGVKLKRLLKRRLVGPSFHFVEVERFPLEVDKLWQKASGAFVAIFVRSVEFLNWRFSDCPDLQYRRFIMYSGTEMIGYIITRVGTNEELPVGVIVDFFAMPCDTTAHDALFEHAYKIFPPQVEYLEAAASTESFRQALERQGYFGIRTMRPTIVCTDPELKLLLERHINDWHFTKADHDWDQIHPI